MFFSAWFGKKEKKAEFSRLPEHVAIIMDGNGRWAKKRGLPRKVGHREGALVLKKIARYCSDIGLKHLTVYAFSTENWKRPKDEVEALMDLLLGFLRNAEKEMGGANIVIKVIGDRDYLPLEIKTEIQRVERITTANTGLTLHIALNYGSRDEILHAVQEVYKEAANKAMLPEAITMKMLEDKLYTAGIPDPDLLIRTSGEKRISNFLLWQSAYTEFIFFDVLWPDFKKKHMDEALEEYMNRNRRYGGV